MPLYPPKWACLGVEKGSATFIYTLIREDEHLQLLPCPMDLVYFYLRYQLRLVLRTGSRTSCI